MTFRMRVRKPAPLRVKPDVDVDVLRVAGVIVGTAADFAPDQPHVVDVNGVSAVVVAHHGTIYAAENACPHLGRDLRDACVRGSTITCPAHCRSWDLRTGLRTRTPGQCRDAGRLKLLDVELLPAESCDAAITSAARSA